VFLDVFFLSSDCRSRRGNTGSAPSVQRILHCNMVKMSAGVPGREVCPCAAEAAHGAPCLCRSGLCCCRTDRARRGCQSGMCRTMTQRSKPSRFRVYVLGFRVPGPVCCARGAPGAACRASLRLTAVCALAGGLSQGGDSARGKVHKLCGMAHPQACIQVSLA
jgi:hypothetical protein